MYLKKLWWRKNRTNTFQGRSTSGNGIVCKVEILATYLSFPYKGYDFIKYRFYWNGTLERSLNKHFPGNVSQIKLLDQYEYETYTKLKETGSAIFSDIL